MNKCYVFLEMLPSAAGPYSARIQSIKNYYPITAGKTAKNRHLKALPVQTLAFYDHALKGRLHEEMERILSFIYELDVNIAVSDVARSKGLPMPGHTRRRKISCWPPVFIILL